MDVEHRGLVDDEHVRVEGIFLIAQKPRFPLPVLGEIRFEETVDGLRFTGRGFAHALGGPSGGGGEGNFEIQGGEDGEQALDDGGLAGAGSPREDHDPLLQRGKQGLFLGAGVGQAGLGLRLFDQPDDVAPVHAGAGAFEIGELLRDIGLGVVAPGLEDIMDAFALEGVHFDRLCLLSGNHTELGQELVAIRLGAAMVFPLVPYAHIALSIIDRSNRSGGVVGSGLGILRGSGRHGDGQIAVLLGRSHGTGREMLARTADNIFFLLLGGSALLGLGLFGLGRCGCGDLGWCCFCGGLGGFHIFLHLLGAAAFAFHRLLWGVGRDFVGRGCGGAGLHGGRLGGRLPLHGGSRTVGPAQQAARRRHHLGDGGHHRQLEVGYIDAHALVLEGRLSVFVRYGVYLVGIGLLL